jgi:hypothetical protein
MIVIKTSALSDRFGGKGVNSNSGFQAGSAVSSISMVTISGGSGGADGQCPPWVASTGSRSVDQYLGDLYGIGQFWQIGIEKKFYLYRVGIIMLSLYVDHVGDDRIQVRRLRDHLILRANSNGAATMLYSVWSRSE